jgi:hypothetical protein
MKIGVARIFAAQTHLGKTVGGDRSPFSPDPHTSSGLPDWTIGLATVGIVLAPYLTTSIEFRKALVTQALMILAIALVVLVVGLVRGGWLAQVVAAPTPIVFGVALYCLATLQGTAVALVRGNDLKLVAGQVLSMALLPLGAVAGLILRTSKSWRVYSIGLVASVALASLFHLSCWAYYSAHGQALGRLFLGNNVSPVGASLLAILLAFALAQDHNLWLRLATSFAIVVIVLYILGTQVRSLWAVAFLGVLLSVAFSRGLRGFASPAAWAPIAGVAFVLLVGLAAITSWWEKPRPNLLSYGQHYTGVSDLDSRVSRAAPEKALGGETPVISLKPLEAGREIPIATAKPIAAPGEYRLRTWVKAESHGTCTLVLQWLDSTGAIVGSAAAAMPAIGDWVPIEAIASAPPSSTSGSLQASCDAQTGGTWLVKNVALEQIGPHLMLLLHKEQEEFVQRLRSLVPWSSRGPPSKDSIWLRQEETRVLLENFVSFSLVGKLFGQGLGAVFYLGDLGKWIYGTDLANYIHNFYIFLLVKLGVVGSLLVLAALAIWIRLTLRSALALPHGPGRAFLASAAAAWLAGCLWSIACPEILDFRFAPLWGLLIAVSIGSSTQQT